MDAVERVSGSCLLAGNVLCGILYFFVHDGWINISAMGAVTVLTVLVLVCRRYAPDPEPMPSSPYYVHIHPRHDECVICYEPMAKNVVMLPCLHAYHEDCIMEWFERKKTCPYCLRPVLDP